VSADKDKEAKDKADAEKKPAEKPDKKPGSSG